MGVRMSAAERQAVARRLERALRDGRLAILEFEERVQAAVGAVLLLVEPTDRAARRRPGAPAPA